MAIAGWTRTDMLVRYTRARAAEEARRLNLGEICPVHAQRDVAVIVIQAAILMGPQVARCELATCCESAALSY